MFRADRTAEYYSSEANRRERRFLTTGLAIGAVGLGLPNVRRMLASGAGAAITRLADKGLLQRTVAGSLGQGYAEFFGGGIFGAQPQLGRGVLQTVRSVRAGQAWRGIVASGDSRYSTLLEALGGQISDDQIDVLLHGLPSISRSIAVDPTQERAFAARLHGLLGADPFEGVRTAYQGWDESKQGLFRGQLAEFARAFYDRTDDELSATRGLATGLARDLSEGFREHGAQRFSMQSTWLEQAFGLQRVSIADFLRSEQRRLGLPGTGQILSSRKALGDLFGDLTTHSVGPGVYRTAEGRIVNFGALGERLRGPRGWLDRNLEVPIAPGIFGLPPTRLAPWIPREREHGVQAFFNLSRQGYAELQGEGGNLLLGGSAFRLNYGTEGIEVGFLGRGWRSNERHGYTKRLGAALTQAPPTHPTSLPLETLRAYAARKPDSISGQLAEALARRLDNPRLARFLSPQDIPSVQRRALSVVTKFNDPNYPETAFARLSQAAAGGQDPALEAYLRTVTEAVRSQVIDQPYRYDRYILATYGSILRNRNPRLYRLLAEGRGGLRAADREELIQTIGTYVKRTKRPDGTLFPYQLREGLVDYVSGRTRTRTTSARKPTLIGTLFDTANDVTIDETTRLYQELGEEAIGAALYRNRSNLGPNYLGRADLRNAAELIAATDDSRTRALIQSRVIQEYLDRGLKLGGDQLLLPGETSGGLANEAVLARGLFGDWTDVFRGGEDLKASIEGSHWYQRMAPGPDPEAWETSEALMLKRGHGLFDEQGRPRLVNLYDQIREAYQQRALHWRDPAWRSEFFSTTDWRFFKQFSPLAGRGRTTDFTLSSMPLHYSAERLSQLAKGVGLGLHASDTGSWFDVWKNLTLKRVLPITALGYYTAYANQELNEHNLPGGSESIQAARERWTRGVQAARQATGGVAASQWVQANLGGSELLREIPGLGGFLDPRTAEEYDQYIEEGYDPIRSGRWWFSGSRTPFQGGRIKAWVPNIYRREASDWQETGVRLTPDEFWSHAPIPTPEHPLCVLPGQPIVTTGGIKPIEEIGPGEVVFNYRGDETLVVGLLSRPADEPAHEIRVAGKQPFPIRVTENHPVLVVRWRDLLTSVKTRSDAKFGAGFISRLERKASDEQLLQHAQWVPAKEVQPDDILLTPRQSFGTLDSIDVGELVERSAETADWVYTRVGQEVAEAIETIELGGYPDYEDKERGRRIREVARRRLKNQSVDRRPRKLSLTSELALLIGLFLAEGHTSYSRQSGHLTFTISADEDSWIPDVQHAVRVVAGVSDVRVEKRGNALHLTVYCKWLANVLDGLCGRGAANKHLPTWMMEAPRWFAEEVLWWYTQGDGWVTSSGRVSSSSVGVILTLQLGLLGEALGYATSTKHGAPPGQRVVCGRLCQTRQSYIVSYSARQRSAVVTEGYILRKVVSNERFHYQGTVYDIEVAEGESFTTPAGIIHNSPLKALFDSRQFERLHQEDRPYPVSSPLFSTLSPWGNVLNATVGRVFKPERFHPQYDPETGLDKRELAAARRAQKAVEAARYGRLVVENGLTRQEGGGYGTGYGSGPGRGGYGPRWTGVPSQQSLEGNLALDRLGYNLQGGGPGTLYATSSGRYGVYQGLDPAMVQAGGTAGQLGAEQLRLEREVEPFPSALISPHSLGYQAEMQRSASKDILGLYGFFGETIAGKLGLGGDKYQDKWVLDDASNATSTAALYWGMNLGALPSEELGSELFRRFLPAPRGLQRNWNPIQNRMPSWMPGRDDYFIDFRHGDPYGAVTYGELLVPGKAYEKVMGGVDLGLGQMSSSDLGDPFEEQVAGILKLGESSSKKLDRINAQGTAFHRAMQQILEDQGRLVGAEIPVRHQGITGYIDAIVRDGLSVGIVDWKTTSAEKIDLLREHPGGEWLPEEYRNYQSQINFYMHVTGIKKAALHFIDRDDLSNQEIRWFRYNKSMAKRDIAQLHAAQREALARLDRAEVPKEQLYSDFERYKVLALTAPYSNDYRVHEALVRKSHREGGLTEEQWAEFERLRDMVKQRKQRDRLFPRQFSGVDLGRQKVDVDRVVGPGTFMSGDKLYRLSGIDYGGLSDDEKARISEAAAAAGLVAGRTLEIVTEGTPSADTYGTIRVSAWSGWTNINRAVLATGAVEAKRTAAKQDVDIFTNRATRFWGSLWEKVSHLDTPYHTKFARIRTPAEEWERGHVYGANYGAWQTPLRDYAEPIAWSMMGKDPISAAVRGAFIGFWFTPKRDTAMLRQAYEVARVEGVGVVDKLAKFAKSYTTDSLSSSRLGRWSGAKVGALFGLGLSLYRILQEKLGGANQGEGYVPRATKEKLELEEYFDKLTFVKHTRLARQYTDLAKEYEETNLQSMLAKGFIEGAERQSKVKDILRRKRELYTELDEGAEKLAVDAEASQAIAERRQAINTELGRLNSQLSRLSGVRTAQRLGPYGTRAMLHREAANRTAYGASATNWAEVASGLPSYLRDVLLTGAETEEDRSRIWKTLPDWLRKPLYHMYGKEAPPAESLEEYFTEHSLPSENWAGFDEDVSLEDVRAAAIDDHKGLINPMEMGVWPQVTRGARERLGPDFAMPAVDVRNRPEAVQSRLRKLLHVHGVKPQEVSFGYGAGQVELELLRRNDPEVVARL
jgi:hypothetical protein